MQQEPDRAEKEDDKASTVGVSSLDFNFLSDFENGADALETNEPGDEGNYTLEPPSAFMETSRTLMESALRAILKIQNRDSSWNQQEEEE